MTTTILTQVFILLIGITIGVSICSVVLINNRLKEMKQKTTQLKENIDKLRAGVLSARELISKRNVE